MAITNAAGTANYDYGYNAHGDISMIVAAGGTASSSTTSYACDSYGRDESALSAGDTQATDPLNPYRYTSNRLDPGSNTLATGVRRYSSDVARFLQRDTLPDATQDLDIASDEVSQNRYILAGADPGAYREADGHSPVPISGGGSVDYMGKLPRTAHYRVAILPGKGTVRGGLFIMAKWVRPGLPFSSRKIPGVGKQRGDGRSFNKFAAPDQYRAYFQMNFNTGQGLLRINPSCNTKKCVRPAPLHHSDSFFHRHGFASFPFYKQNVWDAGGSSDFSAHLHVSLVNPIVFGAPAISDRIYFGALEPLGSDPRFRISMTRDRFPSLEIYHDLRRTTNTLCLSRERHLGDLFPVHRNASSCDFQRTG